MLIVPSFLLFGIEGYSRFRENADAVAEVAGKDITRVEWDARHKDDVQRELSANPKADPKQFDTPLARYNSLERIVNERVFDAAVQELGLLTGDQRLRRLLQSEPTFASLLTPDGKLDVNKFNEFAARQNLTPAELEARMRSEYRNRISSRQVSSGVTGTAFTAAALADVNLAAYLDKREVQIARFDAVAFAPKVEVSDADAEAYYKANTAQFQTPEQANVEYVVLDVDSVKKNLVASDAELKAYYEQNKERFAEKEKRRASHILISAPKTAQGEERQKARAKADELLAAVKKNPDSFAEVARKNSADPGSAAKGGDLDFFGKGAMVKPFEDTAFALKKGEISGVVETDYGFHIIKLTDIAEAKQRSFEEVRADIDTEWKRQQAQQKFAAAAEEFTDMVFSKPDSLQPAADKFKLGLITAVNVTRKPAPGATGILANAKLLDALFAADATQKKHNTPAVDLGNSQLVSARVVQYNPARTQPFAEVKAQVVTKLQVARGADLARKEGQAKLAAWQANPAQGSFQPPVTVSRIQPLGIPASVMDAAMRADTAKLPALVGVDLGDQGYAVVKVNKQLDRSDETEDARKADRSKYAQVWSSAEFGAYFDWLKQRLKVKILVPKPDLKALAAAADTP